MWESDVHTPGHYEELVKEAQLSSPTSNQTDKTKVGEMKLRTRLHSALAAIISIKTNIYKMSNCLDYLNH